MKRHARRPSMFDRALTSTRVLGWVRLLYGSALVWQPRALLGDLADARIDRRAARFARLLGARQIVQAAILGRHVSRSWILAGVAVDATHAATMVGLALLDRRRRLLASANALAASAFALAGVHEARRV